jgi:hypothetical protein
VPRLLHARHAVDTFHQAARPPRPAQELPHLGQGALRQSKTLARLLTHYADLGAADREAWQDRLMDLEGAEPRDLVRLHGQLIASGWIEQNTGVTSVLKPGVVAACYRVTAAGLRALRQARDGDPGEGDGLAEAGAEVAGRSEPRRASRKGKAKPSKAAAAVPAS